MLHISMPQFLPHNWMAAWLTQWYLVVYRTHSLSVWLTVCSCCLCLCLLLVLHLLSVVQYTCILYAHATITRSHFANTSFPLRKQRGSQNCPFYKWQGSSTKHAINGKIASVQKCSAINICILYVQVGHFKIIYINRVAFREISFGWTWMQYFSEWV